VSTSPQAALLVKGGPDDGNTIMLSLGTTVIGRTPPNDIVVDDPGVSRQHASIQGDAEGYSITDLDSLNGTFVNDQRLGKEPYRLRNWDRIQLGGLDTHWVFMETEGTIAIPKYRNGG
jgi:pSer/pThr/pTyr-binding forkhead associated (FHA) protein